MKVELQCGDTITIPEGCKAIVKDGSVVFEKEEQTEEKKEEQDFKDGDVLHSILGDTMLIFKATCSDNREDFESHCNNTRRNNKHWNIYAFRHATEEEKIQFFDTLEDNGYQWNAEEKRVEKLRWRAKKGYIYHRLTCYLRSTNERDDYQTWDQTCHDSYNYFHTEEQTKEAAKRVKETLRKYHEEIGE